MNRPSNNYLTEINQCVDKLVNSLDEIELKLGCGLLDLKGKNQLSKKYFECIILFLSKEVRKESEIWLDVGWIAAQVLKVRYGNNYLDIFNNQILPIEKSFLENKSEVLGLIYDSEN